MQVGPGKVQGCRWSVKHLPCEASLRAWGSPAQEAVLRIAEFVWRVHVEFAVLAAQKAYFDLQMAAFYM